MTIVSIVLHVRPKRTHLFRDTARKRIQHRICKNMSRGFTSLGVYHSHHSERKGGDFAPHIHLAVDVPDTPLSSNGLMNSMTASCRATSPHFSCQLEFQNAVATALPRRYFIFATAVAIAASD
jgi:hypothetical protein